MRQGERERRAVRRIPRTGLKETDGVKVPMRTQALTQPPNLRQRPRRFLSQCLTQSHTGREDPSLLLHFRKLRPRAAK